MSETITETASSAIDTAPAVVGEKTPDIERIIETLLVLSPERVREAADFIAYLAERERKHKAFVEETLAAEANTEKFVFKNSKELITAALASVSEDA
ncbi:hypothetical protein [Candidatus Magnetominusculus xianensis]|uniref:DUF2281 domain-containing protein n=1 Tax=Candidatus Magnetominusculus xianensis TaxID=1748249 RepID=A0ABR5SHM9_9BACT|nr:hypothetical protein [Candidatus Magnetominusculus xianensis]KWT87640.1 hypothetical protein ASN18_1317 [Candidatus Magnetominusculus xianensis]MBF0405671.1 hypothetical protein [Nitrospirota bacterium]